MITIENLSFSYSKKKSLFKNLDLNIGSGKICGLLGKNGAGKTTLLRQLIGLLYPQEGTITVHGNDVTKRNPDTIKEIFYVQEDFELPSMPISLYQKLYSPFYENFDTTKFYELLNKFEVEINSKTSDLSFGQKKKVQIAFALSTGVKLLILDEPTNGLDIPSKAQFRKVVISSIGEEQSVIISSHQVRDLSNLLDQVILIEDGRVTLNEDIFDISTKLSFQQTMGSDVPSDALYSEMIPGGHLVVVPNESGEQSQVDLEALFNAVILSKERVSEIFKSSKQNQNDTI